MKEMRIRLIAVLGALALVVAACGNGVVDDTTTTAPPDDDVTTTEPDTTEPTDPDPDDELTDEIGVIEVNPGESIQIRAHQSLTGDAGPLGEDQVRGVELAIDDFGDIHGFPVDLGAPEDDLCSAEGGQAGAQAIVAQDRVVAVIGTTCSGAAVPAAPVYSGAGMVMFSGSNTNPALTSDLLGTVGENYFPGYFRTAHNDLYQGAAVAAFVAEELGLTRAAAVHDGDPYTQGLAAAFRAPFENVFGGEVPVFTATTGEAGVDQTALLTEIAAADVEVVFFPIFPQTGGPEIIQQQGGIAGLEDIVWFSADGLFVADFLGLPESVGMYFSGPSLEFGENRSATGVSYSEMIDAYVERYGESPPAAFHAHTYDATVLVLSAIEAVSVVGDDGVLRIPQQALRDWLHDVRDFPGIIGPLSCDDFGDCGAPRIQIAEHQTAGAALADVPVVGTFGPEDLVPMIEQAAQ
jgi:branched-chain amino acid transport system substrate-binding protein